MKKQSLKAMVSTLLIVCFIVLALTGSLLYFGKTGVIWGFSRSNLRTVHFVAAILICLLAVAHVFLSVRVYRAELRSLQHLIKNKTARAAAEKEPASIRNGEQTDEKSE